jgi:hypothetical protein
LAAALSSSNESPSMTGSWLLRGFLRLGSHSQSTSAPKTDSDDTTKTSAKTTGPPCDDANTSLPSST